MAPIAFQFESVFDWMLSWSLLDWHIYIRDDAKDLLLALSEVTLRLKDQDYVLLKGEGLAERAPGRARQQLGQQKGALD